jgi:hypothetical protein
MPQLCQSPRAAAIDAHNVAISNASHSLAPVGPKNVDPVGHPEGLDPAALSALQDLREGIGRLSPPRTREKLAATLW